MLFVDIETSSPDASNKYLALNPRMNRIDLVGMGFVDRPEISICNEGEAKDLNVIETEKLCGHGFKFDYKTLYAKGFEMDPGRYEHDTLIMAVASTTKVPDSYIDSYETERRRLNEELPNGEDYREASKHGLKVLAPYFLGVSPFWENPATTNDPEYLKKDILYTKGLYEHFTESLKKEGVYNFYLDKLMPWQRMTLQAELDGIRIDLKAMEELKSQAEAGVLSSLKKLREAWGKVEEEWLNLQRATTADTYKQMKLKALEKIDPEKRTPERIQKLENRYKDLETKQIAKIEPFNYASPDQLLWAFKEVLHYPSQDLNGKESTKAEVLELMAADGKEDIKALLEYRANFKLAHSYFPDYQARLTKENRIHCNFNLNGTRTGRLSCSEPNLQQIPPLLKRVFIPAEGHSFISLDLSSIEPVLIAYYSEDETLCKIFINGGDFHGQCAVDFFCPIGILPANLQPKEVKGKFPDIRYAAKQGDLSIFYGSGKKRLFNTLLLNGIKVNEQQCSKMVYRFRDRFKDAWLFKQMLDAELLAGNCIENLLGRKFKIDEPKDVYMKGFNRLIQSSASDLLLQATNDCLKECQELNIPAALRLLVHDNSVLEAPDEYASSVYDLLMKHMTKFKLATKWGNIPLNAEGGYGKTWKC